MKFYAIALSISVSFLASCSQSDSATTYAPLFQAKTIGHGRFYLNQQLGKVVVLSFWQTTCILCKKELVELNTLYAKHKDRGLVVVAICTDPENRDSADRILKGLGLNYPVLLDEGGSVGAKYKVTAYPTTVLIDCRGRVLRTEVGYSAGIGRQLGTRIVRALSEEGGK